MKLVDKVWSKGDGAENEDIANQVGDFAWVLDGATAVVKHPVYTPRWLAEQADIVFAKGALECKSLPSLLNYYLAHFPMEAECRALQPEQRPSFAGAIIHVKDNRLETFHLADCYTVLNNKTDIEILRDDDYAARCHLAPTNQKEFYTLSKDAQTERLIQRRRTMNTPDGYWVGTADGEAFRCLRTQQIEIPSQTDIILCSDGFERAVSFGILSWGTIFQSNLEHVVKDLRARENDSHFMSQFMQVKRSDDAMAIKLKI